MVRIGYWAMLVYVFLSYSSMAQLTARGVRFPLAIAGIAILIALLGGRFINVLASKVGTGYLALTALFCLGIPFGAYAMGSIDVLLNIWLKHFVVFILVAALVTTRKGCSNLMLTVALASSAASLAAIMKGTTMEGRLMLGDTSLNDPNTLALTGLFGLPMWMSVFTDRSRFALTRLAAVLMTLPIIVAIFMTGSRGAMVAAFLVGLYLLKRLSLAGKTTLIAAGAVAVVLAGTMLSEGIFQRYQGLVSDEVEVGRNSQDSRIALAKQGVILFLRNPVFGVGIGMFAVAEHELAMAQGFRKGSWHTVHNMYLEVLSEGGLFAFICYMWILFKTSKDLGQLERLQVSDHPYARQIRLQAFWMRIAFLLFCTAGAFLSIALSQYFAVFTALPLALRWIVASEAKTVSDQAAAENVYAGEGPVLAGQETLVRGLR